MGSCRTRRCLYVVSSGGRSVAGSIVRGSSGISIARLGGGLPLLGGGSGDSVLPRVMAAGRRGGLEPSLESGWVPLPPNCGNASLQNVAQHKRTNMAWRDCGSPHETSPLPALPDCDPLRSKIRRRPGTFSRERGGDAVKGGKNGDGRIRVRCPRFPAGRATSRERNSLGRLIFQPAAKNTEKSPRQVSWKPKLVGRAFSGLHE